MLYKDIKKLSDATKGQYNRIYIDENGIKYKGQTDGRILRLFEDKYYLEPEVDRLSKKAIDVDNTLIHLEESNLPEGGTAGQVLAKIDSTNYNAHWIDQTGSDVDECCDCKSLDLGEVDGPPEIYDLGERSDILIDKDFCDIK